MTYEERQQAICKECNIHDERCAYFTRNMQDDCPKITSRMVGWELGYKDAISKTYDWLIERYENQGVVLLDDIYELKQVLEEQQ